MTEKRFECGKGSRIIIDNETNLHYIMTLDWECNLVTKLLNHFSEENEQLKSSDTITDLETEIMKLKKENEQLKQSYKEFEDECQSTFNAMSRKQNDLYRKNFKLKEENEQLKNEKAKMKKELSLLAEFNQKPIL